MPRNDGSCGHFSKCIREDSLRKDSSNKARNSLDDFANRLREKHKKKETKDGDPKQQSTESELGMQEIKPNIEPKKWTNQ